MSNLKHGGRPSKRHTILMQSLNLARRVPPKQFTMDAVCEESSVSKGGVLYHFPSLHELVFSMFKQYINDYLHTTSDIKKLSELNLQTVTHLLQSMPVEENLELLFLRVFTESKPHLSWPKELQYSLSMASTDEVRSLYATFGERVCKIHQMFPTKSTRDISNKEQRESKASADLSTSV